MDILFSSKPLKERERAPLYLIVFALISLFACGSAIAGTTERVSVDSEGQQALGGHSSRPVISADDRFVAFESNSVTLVPGVNGSPTIYVHDRQTGITEFICVDSAGNPANFDCRRPSISADGRFVAFFSGATNLVPNGTFSDTNVFVHDRLNGTTEIVSVDSDGQQGANGSDSAYPSISSDGRFVAFYSTARLVPNYTNSGADVYIRDRMTGITEIVSFGLTGMQADGSSIWPSISADGRFVAFWSEATNLVTNDTNGLADIFVHDRQNNTTERVSVDSAGQQGNDATDLYSQISADGRYVVFQSAASNLVTDDTNEAPDIFVHDRQSGITERINVSPTGQQGIYGAYEPAISADGRYVAFQSPDSNLVLIDTNETSDVFVHDRQSGINELVSTDSAEQQGNLDSRYPSISADGRFVAFRSSANNLVPNDTNSVGDIFVRDRESDIVQTEWSIAPSDIGAIEADVTIAFNITRTSAFIGETIWFSTVQNLGSQNDSDYVGQFNSPIYFAPGVLNIEQTVDVLPDDVPEDNENFSVIIQTNPDDPIDVNLASATFTIIDDDVVSEAPVLSVEPSSREFDTIAIDSSSELPITVTNAGKGTLTGSCSTQAPFAVPNCQFELSEGVSQEFSTSFSPTQSGSFLGNIEFTSNVSDFSVVVTGEAIETPLTPNFEISPLSHDFEAIEIDSSSPAQVIRILSTGAAELELGQFVLGGEHAEEFMLDDACNFATLPPKESCLLEVTFEPTSEGVKNAIITYETNVPLTPLPIELVGEGVSAEVERVDFNIIPSVYPSGNLKIGKLNVADALLKEFGGQVVIIQNEIAAGAEYVKNCRAGAIAAASVGASQLVLDYSLDELAGEISFQQLSKINLSTGTPVGDFLVKSAQYSVENYLKGEPISSALAKSIIEKTAGYMYPRAAGLYKRELLKIGESAFAELQYKEILKLLNKEKLGFSLEKRADNSGTKLLTAKQVPATTVEMQAYYSPETRYVTTFIDADCGDAGRNFFSFAVQIERSPFGSLGIRLVEGTDIFLTHD